MRTITVLGSTGSVGRSTVDLLLAHRDRYQVRCLTGGRNAAVLASQAIALGAEMAVISDPAHHATLKEALAGQPIRTAAGDDAVVAAAAMPVDWTMAAITGAAGLQATLAAIRRGGAIAFANKEALVCAGEVMLQAVRDAGATLLPVDSEHNAIFQAMAEDNGRAVERIILTASGGPFRTATVAEMRVATPEAALRHPVWSMGSKISIDSATLFNKGLELIEAARLFDLPESQVDVLVHPQSVVHGLVCYSDGSVLAQLGSPDMRIPIAHCLAWPERLVTSSPRLDLAADRTAGLRRTRHRTLSSAAAVARCLARRGWRPHHPECRQRGCSGGFPGAPAGLPRDRPYRRGGARSFGRAGRARLGRCHGTRSHGAADSGRTGRGGKRPAGGIGTDP